MNNLNNLTIPQQQIVTRIADLKPSMNDLAFLLRVFACLFYISLRPRRRRICRVPYSEMVETLAALILCFGVSPYILASAKSIAMEAYERERSGRMKITTTDTEGENND